ncbi:MAG: VRR-NUC domain-containing protein [Minisyncoccia bacterium]
MSKPIMPEDMAKENSEHSQQVALFMWASMMLREGMYPELRWMFAVPNGGDRSISVAASLVAEGVKSGVSDVVLPCARGGMHGLFIEMKRPKPPGKTSPQQDEFMAAMTLEGYECAVCWTWLEAVEVICEYLAKERT